MLYRRFENWPSTMEELQFWELRSMPLGSWCTTISKTSIFYCRLLVFDNQEIKPVCKGNIGGDSLFEHMLVNLYGHARKITCAIANLIHFICVKVFGLSLLIGILTRFCDSMQPCLQTMPYYKSRTDLKFKQSFYHSFYLKFIVFKGTTKDLP